MVISLKNGKIPNMTVKVIQNGYLYKTDGAWVYVQDVVSLSKVVGEYLQVLGRVK